MNELLRLPDVLREYHVSRWQVQRMHARGLLKLYKRVGERATLIRRADIERALTVPRPRGRPRGTQHVGGV